MAGKGRFHALKAHYLTCGLTLRQHGNLRRLPPNTLSFDVTKNAATFLQRYAEDHAILLPGRIPGYKRDDLQLLPSSTTKKVCTVYHSITFRKVYELLQAVWIQYKLSCDEACEQAAEYSTFCTLWRKLVPYITVMKPLSDLCWVCQKNSNAIMKAANTPEEDKSVVINTNYNKKASKIATVLY